LIQDPITAHSVHAAFEALAMFAGGRYYAALRRRTPAVPTLRGPAYWILLGCLLGAALGNKLVFLLEQPVVPAGMSGWAWAWSGQSMVGGLLGGLLGTEAAKALTRQRQSTGDLFVAPLLLAIAIGRIGCFLAGVHDGTHGLPTTLPWGMDLGDGLTRHPAALYEIAFVLALWGLLGRAAPALAPVPGLRFKLMLVAYLLWRLLVDGLKPVPFAYPLGWSGIQWVCALALLIYAPWLGRALRQWRCAPPLPPA
jgi:phosphatidylglycerol:prolipoprotein diacylglycerol transferase